ncbi:BPL-N domain-containing protein [Rhodococcus triatomae]
MSPIGRRGLLVGAAAVGAAGVAAAVGIPRLAAPDDLAVALVYRGPAASPGCPEAVAHLLESAPTPLRAVYVGPDEDADVDADSLAGAVVYAQPGGGDLAPAWRHTHGYAPVLRDWVGAGGTYLGFCLGAYLAGDDPGYGLLPGARVRQYIGTDDATVHDTGETVVAVTWRDQPRHMYFQDGTVFRARGDDWGAVGATVLARYPNDTVAAVVAPYGTGRVGLVGPHPEADASWYAPNLTNPDGIRFDLGHDLVETTLTR